MATPEDPCAALLHALRRVSSPDHVNGLLIHDLPEVVGASAASVALLDSTGEWVEIVASRGYSPQVLRQLSRFRADADIPLADAIRTNRTLVLESGAPLTRRYSAIRPIHIAPSRRSLACVPISAGGHVIGAVGLSFDEDISGDHPVRALLDRVAGDIGAAMFRVLMRRSADDALDGARNRLAFISAATRELARYLDSDEILDTFTQLVVPRFADWASVLLPEGHELVAATLVHRDHQDDHPRRRAGAFRCAIDGATVSAEVFRTGEARSVAGIDEDVRARMDAFPELRASLAATRVRMVVPITAHDRILGIITLGDSSGRGFQPDDLTVAVELASRAGTALDHAARYAAERTMVEVLQRAVLPDSLPHADSFDVAARYLPASTEARVGGDWYDAFDLRDGRVGICVGDVVGHGIEAAACMGQLRNALRAYALDGDAPPVVMERLNAYAFDTATTDFTTATYGVYEPASGALEWTSAGHPPIWIHRRSGEVEVHRGPNGLPVGVSRSARYDASSTALDRGDLLVACTDGLLESRVAPLDDGIDRVSATLTRVGRRSVEDVAEALVAPVSGSDRADDVCVLVLARSHS